MLIANVAVKTVRYLLSATFVELAAHGGDVLGAQTGVEKSVEPSALGANFCVRRVFLFPNAVRLERSADITVKVDLRRFLLRCRCRG